MNEGDLTTPQGVIGYEMRDGLRYKIVDLGTAIVSVLVDEIVTRPMHEFVCLDCGEDKTLGDMATESPDLSHALTGQRTGSCKECYS